MTVYRLFFHRLRDFPGPVFARVTKLWHVLQCLDSRNHLVMERLHQQYGDIVRIGPRELAIFAPDAVAAVSEDQGQFFSKPDWYDNLRPYVGLTNIRDRQGHVHRRRIWDRGFSAQALRSYEPQIKAYASQLEQIIAQEAGQPMIANEIFSWFSFDVMGQFAFSRSLNMLRTKMSHHAVEMLHSGMDLLGPFSPVPWLIRIGFELPVLPIARELHKMAAWCIQQMDERLKVSASQADVSHYLIQWSAERGTLETDRDILYGDAISLIVAGSDTVALTLTYIFYRLANHPEHLRVLQKELDDAGGIDEMKVLQSLLCLNGIINETMRLHPVIPTGVLRETPPEGAMICGHFIPGHTVICTPRYTIARLESCFEQGLEFVPSRWYSQPEMIKNKRAFAPFGLGHYSCIGKHLAYNELRYVTALLASKYNIAFAPNEDGKEVIENTLDQFTARPGKLRLVFQKRGDKALS